MLTKQNLSLCRQFFEPAAAGVVRDSQEQTDGISTRNKSKSGSVQGKKGIASVKTRED
jgi:hypothetical protein